MIKLKSPLKNWYITQPFGANYNTFYTGMGMKGHNGIDFRCSVGTPIYACHDGVVMGIYQDSAGGLGIDIRTDTYKTRYWHIKEGGFKVKYGDNVKAGDLIAMSGNTGRSTGPHLHFGLKEIYKKKGVWKNKNQDNGYRGGIDPMPYFDIKPYLKRKTILRRLKGLDVKILQALLMAHGYKLKIDGKFGRNTEKMVKDFQDNHNLVGDGIVGKQTWQELYKFN